MTGRIDSFISKRHEYISLAPKIIFIMIAFFLMVFSSEVYVSNIIQKKLLKEVTGMLELTKLRIEYEISIPETALALIASTVRDRIADGADEEELLDYLIRFSEHMQADEKLLTFHLVRIYGSFGVYGGKYLNGYDWQLSGGYDPTDSPWYTAAVEAGGDTAVTMSYTSLYDESGVMTYSRGVYGDGGELLCVLCLDAQMDYLAEYIESISVTEGSYRILLNENLTILSHPSPEFIGKNAAEVHSVFTGLTDELKTGADIIEHEGKNYKDVTSITYSSHIGNGWIVSVTIPKNEYFNELSNIRLFIVVLGFILATSLSVILVRIDLQKQRASGREREAIIQRQAAQTANEAKSQFLANMSHEIRTPMNAVLGMAELLLQENMNKRQLQYAGDIKMSAMSLLNIINDILDLSKIQSGKFSLSPVHYDFDMLIDSVGSVVQFLIYEKNVSFELDMQEHEESCLYGDDIRLRQVFLNLLGNAVKFTPEGHIRLTVRFTDTTVGITVSDTGIGIPSENIHTLFDAFEQADVLTNRNTKGTGLGLTITKSIVEMMNGRISAESVYGHGASFHVEIPKILGDASMIRRYKTNENPISAPDARILVVDDNRTNLTVAAGLLEGFGIKAETAESGSEAMELVRKNKYDMVFMDHRMPGMNGVETTRAIRESGADVPIISLTASVYPEVKGKMLESGMNDYLTKPIIKTELIRILKKWIPDEKIIKTNYSETDKNGPAEEGQKEFWAKTEAIAGLDLTAGLQRVDGRRDLYEKTLRLTLLEIEKSDGNLNKFMAAGDMENFGVEVHGIRGTLANIGAMELSAAASELEAASDNGDCGFCVQNLPDFLKNLNGLHTRLSDAFSVLSRDDSPSEIPPELPLAFDRLAGAFDETDLVLIDREIEIIDALNLRGKLRDDVEKIKDAVMMMDYAGAAEYMNRLLGGARRLGKC